MTTTAGDADTASMELTMNRPAPGGHGRNAANRSSHKYTRTASENAAGWSGSSASGGYPASRSGDGDWSGTSASSARSSAAHHWYAAPSRSTNAARGSSSSYPPSG